MKKIRRKPNAVSRVLSVAASCYPAHGTKVGGNLTRILLVALVDRPWQINRSNVY